MYACYLSDANCQASVHACTHRGMIEPSALSDVYSYDGVSKSILYRHGRSFFTGSQHGFMVSRLFEAIAAKNTSQLALASCEQADRPTYVT